MSWEGDWMCGVCQHMNFKKRDSCQRCGYSKYSGEVDSAAYGYYNSNTDNNSSRNEVLAGDWYCQALNCGGHNYASRTSCYRCGTQKPEHSGVMGSGGYGSEFALPGWKTGDWMCTRPGCGQHNYACRTECYKCKLPRDDGENPSSSST